MQQDRVTNVQLRDAIAEAKEDIKVVITAEQKTEHFKTRVLVVVSAMFTGGAKIASALGYISFPHPHL